jgi:metallophosphoesterase (TIGR00282 family)
MTSSNDNGFEIVFLGDVVGLNALNAVIDFASKEESVFKVVNVENVAKGFGIGEDSYKKLTSAGFSLFSGGNHIWDNKEIFNFIDRSKIARPYNYPKGTPGKGYSFEEKNGVKVALINLLGRVFMNVSSLNCPFRAADEALEEVRSLRPDIIVVDIHAEATAEKLALAKYLDGRVSLVVGTHTHVQTADELILPGGTAYITDLGACAPKNSVLGMSFQSVLPKFLTGLPSKMQVANGDEGINICGVRCCFDDKFKAKQIIRINY